MNDKIKINLDFLSTINIIISTSLLLYRKLYEEKMKDSIQDLNKRKLIKRSKGFNLNLNKITVFYFMMKICYT